MYAKKFKVWDNLNNQHLTIVNEGGVLRQGDVGVTIHYNDGLYFTYINQYDDNGQPLKANAQVFICTELIANKSYRGETLEDLYIYDGDITELTLADGTVRRFEVAIKTVNRTVKNHPQFDGACSKVAITGVTFLWNNFELFPIVDEYGVLDTAKMKIVGTVRENPELLN